MSLSPTGECLRPDINIPLWKQYECSSATEELLKWMQDNVGGVCRLDEMHGCFPGRGHVQAILLGANAKWYDPETLAEVIQKLPWKEPESVQLIAKGEDDETFRVYMFIEGNFKLVLRPRRI